MPSKLITTFVASVMLLIDAGCSKEPNGVKTGAISNNPRGPTITELTALPPHAKPGECWAKVYVPPTYTTVKERVQVRAASERLEVVPAEYEWVEERIMVKEASSELVIVPAEFAVRERTIETAPSHTDWEVKESADCDVPSSQPARDVFCLVAHPPEQRTVREEYLVKPPSVEERTIPAEYQTVRKQRLVRAATIKKVAIPAEFAEVERTVKASEARIAWKRVACEGHLLETDNLNSQIPSFEWPPPAYSAIARLPRSLILRDCHQLPVDRITLSNVGDCIVDALTNAGYPRYSYYQLTSGPGEIPFGFAIAAQLERIKDDGSPEEGDRRFELSIRSPSKFSEYIHSLFRATSGRYRVIVFMVTSSPIPGSTVQASESVAGKWPITGASDLPDLIKQIEFEERFQCSALIYEFVRPTADDENAEPVPASKIPGIDHLRKAKIPLGGL
ncbi:MAG TPA: hypothetical protein VJZ71_06305 [Phycisphaerae bacterium]|nr:hypothetical protein [Phycisphaerae bacterium]